MCTPMCAPDQPACSLSAPTASAAASPTSARFARLTMRTAGLRAGRGPAATGPLRDLASLPVLRNPSGGTDDFDLFKPDSPSPTVASVQVSDGRRPPVPADSPLLIDADGDARAITDDRARAPQRLPRSERIRRRPQQDPLAPLTSPPQQPKACKLYAGPPPSCSTSLL